MACEVSATERAVQYPSHGRRLPGGWPVGRRARRVVIRNTSGYYSPGSAITFENKVLTIDHDVDDVEDRTDYLIRTLEKGL